MSIFTDYDDFDAVGLGHLVSQREVSAEDLVETAIARIEKVNGRINAVIHPLYQQARHTAERPRPGPFSGVPFLLKDLIQTMVGVPTVGGSRFWRGWVPHHDTELYRRYRDSGLIVVGKTNTPENGLLPVTEPEIFGPTRTPWDLTRTSGGSSGGSAAAVAAGIVPMAHGGDGGGSIRIPAACCGVFGLKPTRARTPCGPDASEHWAGFAIEHVITRSVRDSAVALDATQGAEPSAAYHAPPLVRPLREEVGAPPGRLRIGFHADPAMPSSVHPDCVDAAQRAARMCEALGHDVEEVKPGHHPHELGMAFFTVVAAQTAAEIHAAEVTLSKKAMPDDFETSTWLSAMMGRRFSAIEYANAVRELQAESRRLVRVLGDYDVILTPTLGQPPVPIGALQPSGLEASLHDFVKGSSFAAALRIPGVVERTVERVFDFIPFTAVANFTGQPAMNVPLVWNKDGLPIGTMFAGRFGGEATLIRLASQLEQAHPWADRRPPVWAGR